MTRPDRAAVNILNRYGVPLFEPHFDLARDGFDVVENGSPDREWDLLIVFEAMATPARYKVRRGGTIFVGGEPPEIADHSPAFLRQFDAVFCAGARADAAPKVSREQHFNNWHFGYSADRGGYRYDHYAIRDIAPPSKARMLSTVTSNLNYLPMHIRRRSLIDRLSRDYSGRIDFFGRPHRFVEYKEEAILPYRFHLCIENCAIEDLWTEKVADALLSYAVPVYAGCPNIEQYFPGATIAIDLDDYAKARATIDEILADGEAIYARRFDALLQARKRLITEFDMSTLAASLLRATPAREFDAVELKPEAHFPLAKARELMARARRKAVTLSCRIKGKLHA